MFVRTLPNMESCCRVRKNSDVSKRMNLNLIIAELSLLRVGIAGATVYSQ